MAMFTFTFAACAEEHGKSYLLRHAGITLPQAVQIAEANGPGRAISGQLKQSGTRVYYDIEIVDNVNKARNIRVDAGTGKIIRSLTLP
jgi:uncharacterized membrane protein YkoI